MENNIENQQLNKLVDNYVELKHAVKVLCSVMEDTEFDGANKILMDTIIGSAVYNNVKSKI